MKVLDHVDVGASHIGFRCATDLWTQFCFSVFWNMRNHRWRGLPPFFCPKYKKRLTEANMISSPCKKHVLGTCGSWWFMMILVFFCMVENRANNIAVDEKNAFWFGTVFRQVPRGVSARGTVGYIYSLNIQCKFASLMEGWYRGIVMSLLFYCYYDYFYCCYCYFYCYYCYYCCYCLVLWNMVIFVYVCCRYVFLIIIVII